ncbi:probable cytochrome P450 6a17 [Culex pipiens pallens]|uniref:probable cytochrome P450 6a17 n=1 Tax=Culex pipiens pallens TaxID=42434 RepID=UPI00195334C3|nr:probable cytochrome P450 6a17 [Culex pipiens pallens]
MLFYLALVAVSLTFFWVGRRFSYWKQLGVPYVEASFPFGNLKGMNKRHLGYIAQDLYVKLKSTGKKFGGAFFFVSPTALILDLDFAKDVFVKDFQYFHDRGVYCNEKADPITAHLVTMSGTKWKNLRTKLTPTFTSGKMKMMFPTIVGVAEEFRKGLLVEAEAGGEVEMKEFLARFTTDVIGTCAFGLECNSLKDPDAEFRRMGKKALTLSTMDFLRRILTVTFKDVAMKFNVRLSNPDVANFFMNAVRETVDYREKNKIQRNDFMDLLIRMKNVEPIEGGDPNQVGQLTIEEIAAQSFVFFLAGFETSSTAMTFCLYELAQNQELQDKARNNVLDVLKEHGSISYEAVHDMKYIEMCINESLRKYPPIANILREVTKDYHVPDMNVTLPKGHRVMLPIYAIHHDPEYYPVPDQYDPERFKPAAVAARHQMAFVPFGEGPRVCIGQRFGMMQARVGLAYLLKNFRFRLSEKTSVPLKILASSTVLATQGGLWLHIEKL